MDRVVAEAGKHHQHHHGGGPGWPITIHRPCGLVAANHEETPSEDSLNAILRYSTLLRAVPQLSGLSVSGYFDLAPVEDVGADIAAVVMSDAEQPPLLRFRHYSSGVRVRPSEFRAYLEKLHGVEFAELALEDWIGRSLECGMEPMIAVYLRAVVEDGKEMVLPFMGNVPSVGS